MRRASLLGRLLAISLGASLLLAACHKARFDEAAWRERGVAALRPFQKSLKKALLTGLEQGPAQAIDACRLEAPRLAASAGSEDVRVGRTSHKLRNPANAPEPWMLPLLEGYRDEAYDEPRVVEIDASTVGYVEPIYMQSLCASCHGSNLAPGVLERLHALYPEDQATGFAVGDFRGLFWVKMRR
jgi:hypothetical protein